MIRKGKKQGGGGSGGREYHEKNNYIYTNKKNENREEEKKGLNEYTRLTNQPYLSHLQPSHPHAIPRIRCGLVSRRTDDEVVVVLSPMEEPVSSSHAWFTLR